MMLYCKVCGKTTPHYYKGAMRLLVTIHIHNCEVCEGTRHGPKPAGAKEKVNQ